MKVLLKPGWKINISVIKLKIYPLGNKFYQQVDKTFDEIHRLGRIKFIFKYILFSFFIFVVCKIDIKGKKKAKSN